jgi:MFS family permease
MSASQSPEPVYPPARYAWYACSILLLAYIFSFLDRTIISLLVIPIEQDLGLTDTELSLVQGFSFAIFYALLGLPIARWVDSSSRRRVISWGIFFWSFATAACGLASRFWHLFLARVGVGAGEAALLPGATSLLADYFPPQRRGVAVGVFATGIFLGGGLALILGGLLIKTLTGVHVQVPLLGEFHTWQLVFVAVGLPGLIVSLLMWTVREPPRLGTAAGAKGLPLAEVIAYYRANTRTLLSHLVGFTMLSFSGIAATAWIPTFFIRIHGWTAAETGVRYGAMALALGPLGSVVGGWLGDRLERHGLRNGKFRVALGACVGVIPFAIAFPLVPSPWLSYMLAMPMMFFISFVWGLAPAALQEIMPNQMRGLATAFYTGILNLVSVGMGATSVALLADYGLGGPQHLHEAIAIITPAAALMAAIAFWAGLRPYAVTLDHLKTWAPAQTGME